MQRGAGLRVHPELAVLREQSRGRASSLRHPQYFVHIIVMVCTSAAEHNENVVNLWQ